MNSLAITGGLPKFGGGTSYSIPLWSNLIAENGLKRFLVTTIIKNEEISDFIELNKVKLITIPASRFSIINFLRGNATKNILYELCLKNKIRLIHNHGAWLPINHFASEVSQKLKIPQVITPHGMLTIWCLNNKKLKKNIAWLAYQKRDVESARVIHVTSQIEANELRQIGFRGSFAIIPNGLILKEWVEPTKTTDRINTALFVSRIHPKKGLLNLVDAWSRIHPKGWRMRIVGPDENGHRLVVEKAIQEKGLRNDFLFEGPVFGERLWEIYRESDLFVLPTLSENFANVVPEALSCGLPVLCTHGAPWEELINHKCGWWFPVGVTPLEQALREAISTTRAERIEMGRRGRKLVEEKYTWQSSGKKMKILYEWILGGGPKPDFVQLGSKN